VAARLGATLSGHTIARLGGDEFAVLADVPGGRPQAEALARQVLEALEEPLVAGVHELRSRASVGVALGDGGVDHAGDLLRRADLAMYVAKGQGKASFELFDRHTYETLGVQRRLQAELGAALESGELEVRYQPIVDLATLEIGSAEALVRWHHPTFGVLGPSAFIHLAQDEGLLQRLFELVLHEACVQACSWPCNPTTGAPVAVSVNLAPPQLDDDELVGLVERALASSGLSAALLTLELTENVLVSDPRRAARTMTRLKQLGVALAVDDFGTGYSSLSYLRRLPVDVLKIDQSFIEALDRPDTGSALVRTIVNLGNELGLATVAEGVEREDQRAALRRLGCSRGQGFLFSRPLSAPDFGMLLAQGGVPAPVPTEADPAHAR
jgi:predicted signal transduction protein with EAL and GGDEF domain